MTGIDPATVHDVVVVLPDMIGTTVCAMPAVRAIQTGFPAARVRLFGFEPISRFLCDEPGCEGIALLDPGQLAHGLRRQLDAPDLAFDMLGIPQSLGTLAAGETRHIVSWADHAGHVTRVVPSPAARHQLAVEDYLDFVRAVGLEATFVPPRLTAARSTRGAGDAWLAGRGIAAGETLFALGIGGGNDRKRWPVPRFLELSRRLQAHGRAVFVLGPREAELQQQLPASAVVAASLPLDLAKGILARARLAVCNDHSIMHLAAALGVPTVGIFLASDPAEWFPYPQPSTPVVGPPLDCRPCYSETCEDWACNHPSLAEQVWQQVSRLVAGD